MFLWLVPALGMVSGALAFGVRLRTGRSLHILTGLVVVSTCLLVLSSRVPLGVLLLVVSEAGLAIGFVAFLLRLFRARG